MPKRQSAKADHYEEEDIDEFIVDDDDDEYAEKTKARKAAKRTPKKSRAQDNEDAEPVAKKKAAPKAQRVTEPTLLDDGWTLQPPSLIYKQNSAAQGATKIAAFDLDGTMILRRSASQYGPMDANDWQWYNASVPEKLAEVASSGHQIVIFSNQGTIKGALLGVNSSKIRGLIDNVLRELGTRGVQAQVLLATSNDDFRKPLTGMWDFFAKNLNKGANPELNDCFFVGDAAGRLTDINDGASSDRDFAAAIGLQFHLPEDYFGPPNPTGTNSTTAAAPENASLAQAFQELGDLLKKKGDNFKASAFLKVAAIIAGHPTAIASSANLKGVKGVGKSSMAKVDEFLATGKLAAIEELKSGGEAGATAAPSKISVEAFKFI